MIGFIPSTIFVFNRYGSSKMSSLSRNHDDPNIPMPDWAQCLFFVHEEVAAGCLSALSARDDPNKELAAWRSSIIGD